MLYYIKKFIFEPSSSMVIQFLRSIVAGGIASLADLLTFMAILGRLENYILANTLSFIIGVIINYILNAVWIYESSKRNTKKDILIFLFIGVAGLILSNMLLYVLLDLRMIYLFLPFMDEGWITLFSKCFTIVIVFIFNFAARRKFIFING